MRVTFWDVGSPEDTYERTIKNVENVDFYNGYVRCYKKNNEEVRIETTDIIAMRKINL